MRSCQKTPPSNTGINTAVQWFQHLCDKTSLSCIWFGSSTIILLCVGIVFFNPGDKDGINDVLDARDQAVSSRDISTYSQLIADDYLDNGHDREAVLAQTREMFRVFIELHMHSFDREIRLLGKQQAECRQSYRLKVRSGVDWRQIVEREQISLKKADNRWKISGGL